MRRWALPAAALLVAAACAQPEPPARDGFDASSLSAPEPFRPRVSYNGSAGAGQGSPLPDDPRYGGAAHSLGGAAASGPTDPFAGDPRRAGDEAFARSLDSEALGRTSAPDAAPSGSPVPAPGGGRAYAVIINGDDDHHGTGPKHRVNVELGIAFVRRQYGVAPEDLTVLSPHRGAPATRANVLAAAKEVAGRLRSGDRLIVYTTGHGLKQNGRWMLWLQGAQRVYVDEFAQAFTANAAAELIYIGDQCYSGSFAEAVASAAKAKGKAVVSLSSTDAHNPAVCEFFIRPFFAAFGDVRNDLNGDGRVNEHEAFASARRSHKQALRGSPQLTNSFYLAFAAPPPAG